MFGFDKNKLDSVASSNCGTHLLRTRLGRVASSKLPDSLIKNKLGRVASSELRDSLIKNNLGRWQAASGGKSNCSPERAPAEISFNCAKSHEYQT